MLLLAGAWYGLEKIAWHEDFHDLPPQTIFREVMGRPVPAGVSDLRVVARSYSIKGWVWMRFRATDGAIKSLAEQPILYDDDPEPSKRRAVADALSATLWSANHKYDAEDMASVNWSEVSAILKPEFYQAGRNSETWGSGVRFPMWLGSMIVDRQNHLVYIHAGGD